MENKIMLAVATATGMAIGVALAPWAAQAGHTNSVLEAQLDGRQEVAANGSKKLVGDPDGRGEAYVFGIDGDPTTLCYVLTASKIAGLESAPGNGRAAHIHEGPRGSNGPVVAALAWPQGGQAGDCLTEGEPGKVLTTGKVQEILANPEDYYVNVHNSEYPSGAIRGQLRAND